MAMYDWNGNGNKNDMADNYIEYQIYKDCTRNNSTPRRLHIVIERNIIL
ncbi:MAG: hypothetical protein IJN64_07920 [Lachnospiraceae bacterium]|nr:hypothetical protein [Lachnospiraceae bacterium]